MALPLAAKGEDVEIKLAAVYAELSLHLFSDIVDVRVRKRLYAFGFEDA